MITMDSKMGSRGFCSSGAGLDNGHWGIEEVVVISMVVWVRADGVRGSISRR